MGVSLLLAALLSQAPIEAADAGSPTGLEVAEVELRLEAGANPKLLDDAPGLVMVRKGQQLSARSVRRSIERLMETARFADVEVFQERTPAGLRVSFELKPRQVIGAIYVEGNSALADADVLAPTKLSPDSEFYAERADQAKEAVLQVYRRRGFYDAQVEVRATEGEAGVDVGFHVNEGLPTRLKGVVVAGDPGLPMPRLLHELNLELHEVINLGELEAGLDRLRETLRAEHFYRARVDPAQIEAGGLVVLPIWAGPRIEFGFIGNVAFAPATLRRVIAWDGSEVLDQTVAERLAMQLRSFYRYRGFHDVRVAVRERQGRTPRSALVSFQIDEGPQLVVRSIAFTGNKGIEADELRAVVADVVRSTTPGSSDIVHPGDDPLQLEGAVKRSPFGDPPSPAAETIFVEAAYLEAAKAIGRLYRERGYAAAKVQLQEVDFTPTGATVLFTVEEGPQTLLRAVEFVGAPAGFPDRSAAAAMKAGDPLSDRRLDEWRQALSRDLVRRGFMYGSIESEVRHEADGTRADLVFKVLSGPLVTVGKVLIRGNQRTVESVIRGQVPFVEGEPLDRDALYTSQRALLGLGIFRSVDVRILAEEAQDAVKDIIVEVRESPRATWEPSFGYFFAEGLRGFMFAEFPNLAGRAINVQARGRVYLFYLSGLAVSQQVDVSDLEVWETLGGQGNISASNRGLLPFGIGARVDLVAERTFRQAYRFTRFAGGPGLDWSKSFTVPGLEWTRPKLTLQLGYEAEWSRVVNVNNTSGKIFPLLRADQERLRFLFGTFALHTVRFAPTIDLRDDAVVPRKGLLLQGAIETTLPLETRDEENRPVPVQFVKLSSTVTVYLPWRRFVLAISPRVGTIIPLTNGSVTPPVKRFFLGGSSSLRGFREDGLVAEDQRQSYRRQVNDCKALATKIGCTPAAVTLLERSDIPSQGGELFVLGKAELRFPAFAAFDVGIFFEAGNLWLERATAFSLRPVVGTGLRYVTPIGPIALDIGFNLAPDPVVNEPAFNVHFNIGLF